MDAATREELLRAYAAETAAALERAGDVLAGRQALSGPARGNVPPWPGSDDRDFHGTMAAVWIWSRAQRLAGDDRFALNVAAGWSFALEAWPQVIPASLGPAASDEAPYDCALVLRAAIADRALDGHPERRQQAEAAARLLAAYLSDLDDLKGRDFKDPGFLALNLADFAREVGDRGLLATARRFVERAFGMKAPPSFATEPAVTDGLFDFSSTTATRILAVVAAEGATPFVGAWLRERVVALAPQAPIERPMDGNTWNACMALALGRAFVVSTDARFLEAHQGVVGALAAQAPDGTLGRADGFQAETLPTFYWALALDSLVKA